MIKSKRFAILLGLTILLITGTWQLGVNAQSGSAIVDIVFGRAEAHATRSVSGGYNVGFNVPCTNGSCSHVELSGNPAFRGRQWISGDVQNVRGGSGCLAGVNGGLEPTGRHPAGTAYKTVLRNLTESTGTVEVWRYNKTCNICGCTPYYIPGGVIQVLREGQPISM